MQQLVFLRFMFDVPEGRVIVDYKKIIEGSSEMQIRQSTETLNYLVKVNEMITIFISTEGKS